MSNLAQTIEAMVDQPKDSTIRCQRGFRTRSRLIVVVVVAEALEKLLLVLLVVVVVFVCGLFDDIYATPKQRGAKTGEKECVFFNCGEGFLPPSITLFQRKSTCNQIHMIPTAWINCFFPLKKPALETLLQNNVVSSESAMIREILSSSNDSLKEGWEYMSRETLAHLLLAEDVTPRYCMLDK